MILSIRKWALITAIGLITIAGLWFYIANKLYPVVSEDFVYNSYILSFDNFYDGKLGRFKGKIISKSNFSLRVVGKTPDNNLLIQNAFEVRKPSGDLIININSQYGINPKNGAHDPRLGDKFRNGYLFSPRFPKNTFTYWHINYDSPAQMHFLGEEDIDGLTVYHYGTLFKTDQTKYLNYLNGVPDRFGVELDVALEVWIEPTTGYLIKFQDYSTGWFYERFSKQRVQPWNRFHNVFDENSIHSNVEFAKIKKQKYLWTTAFLPITLIVIALIFLIIGYNGKRGTTLKPYLIVVFTFLLGASGTFYLFFFLKLQESTRKENLFEKDCERIRTTLISEFDKNFQVLQTIKSGIIGYKLINEEVFHNSASFNIKRNQGIKALAWVQVVDNPKNSGLQLKNTAGKYLTPRELRNQAAYIKYIEPGDNFYSWKDIDLVSNNELRKNIILAETTQELVSTYPIQFPDFPGDSQKQILVFAPLFQRDLYSEGGLNALQGIVLGVFDPNQIINQIINLSGIAGQISFEIKDFTSQKVIFSNLVQSQDPELKKSLLVQVGGRLWNVIMVPKATDFANPFINIPIIVLLIGLIVTCFISSFVFNLLTDNRSQLLKTNAQLMKHSNELERKNKELEQFAYIASHDLQEPLHTIQSLIAFLEEETSKYLDEEKRNYIAFVHQTTERMSNLIKGLLFYSKIGNNDEFGFVDLNMTLKEVILKHKQALDAIDAELHYDPLPKVHGLKSELFTVFDQIIDNAIKFRSKDRKLELSIFYANHKQEWFFGIKDNGMGISTSYFERIFVIFQRLNKRDDYPGSGIGLAFCRKIVELHGGKIWVESQLQHGSTFYFTIPKI